MTKMLEAKDIFSLQSVANPVLSPDGTRAVFVRTAIKEEKNTYESYLYHVDLETKKVTQWTYGNERISNVQWSPAGDAVTFLATRTKKNQLYMLRASGGEANVLTNAPYGISNYAWGTDETIWIQGQVDRDQEFTDEAIQKDDAKPEAYVVEGMQYKLNGIGLLPQNRFRQIATLNVVTKEIKRFTNDAYDYSLQAVSHDGQKLVYSVNRNTNKDYDFSSPLYVVDVATKEETLICDEAGYFGGAKFSLTDHYISFVGAPLEPYKNAAQNELYIYDCEQQHYYSLTAMMDAPVGDFQTADVQQSVQAPSVVWCDGDALYFQLSTMGDTRLYYATLDGAIYPATPEDEHVYGYDMNRNANYGIATISNPTSVGELYALNIGMGEREQLTHFNEAFERQHTIVQPEAISFTSFDDTNVFGWLMKPANYERGKKYPVVLNIHGGPHMMYGNTFIFEMQLLAAQGYGVLYINPRGSHSYSQQFVDGCRNDYGNGDYEDLMRGLNTAINENEWIDAERLGVMGGSYGGFMTNWIVGHTDRFKAAITQRSISNWISFYGVSDIGYYFTQWQIGGDMNDVEKLWQHSPLKYAKNVSTPLLILHSEQDDRCPIEQAEQLYITLKSFGKETKFIRFPQANHDLSRSGLPNLRLTRLQEMMDWLKKYV